jgi:hypothetical protein
VTMTFSDHVGTSGRVRVEHSQSHVKDVDEKDEREANGDNNGRGDVSPV